MTIVNESFYFSKNEPSKSCLLVLRSIILQKSDTIIESSKYGMPCFCLRKKVFCYLWMDKKINEPYILFVDGAKLHFPELESGNRSRMKIFRVDPKEDIPIMLIDKLLKAAMDLYE